MTFVAALDCGGTTTRIATMTKAGTITRHPDTTGFNPFADGDIAQALQEALRPIQGAAHVVAGVAGGTETASLRKITTQGLTQALKAPLTLLNDAELARHGAFGLGPGVLLISGTGSIAVGKGPKGTARIGALGFQFSDAGSGYAIGQAALRRAAQALDGSAPLPKGDTLLQDLDIAPSLTDPEQLLEWLIPHSNHRRAIASRARKVVESTSPTAQTILTTATTDLTQLVQTCQDQTGTPLWTAAGSVATSPKMAALLSERLGPPSKPQLSALESGLLLAAQTAGWPLTPDQLHHP